MLYSIRIGLNKYDSHYKKLSLDSGTAAGEQPLYRLALSGTIREKVIGGKVIYLGKYARRFEGRKGIGFE